MQTIIFARGSLLSLLRPWLDVINGLLRVVRTVIHLLAVSLLLHTCRYNHRTYYIHVSLLTLSHVCIESVGLMFKLNFTHNLIIFKFYNSLTTYLDKYLKLRNASFHQSLRVRRSYNVQALVRAGCIFRNASTLRKFTISLSNVRIR